VTHERGDSRDWPVGTTTPFEASLRMQVPFLSLREHGPRCNASILLTSPIPRSSHLVVPSSDL